MAKIYNDFASANLMSFAKSFARLNGQPLDKSEIWYSLAEAQAYAATDAAYVGQILAVIDSENNNVVFYGIQDAAGTLKEVGCAPIGDNLSIEIVDNKIQLANFGKEYYAFVPAVRNENNEIIEPSKYELVEGFKAGLEPRVIAQGENLVIAWYEPGAETIEDVSANVEAVSQEVEILNESIQDLDEALNADGGLVDQVDELKDQVGKAADEAGNEATGLYKALADLEKVVDEKADSNDVYSKEDTDKAIAEAIANVEHLSRVIVDSLESIDVDAPDADLFIYMVPTGLQFEDDKYDEYIVLNGAVERVGSWEIDLTNYATKDYVEGKIVAVNETIGAANNAINTINETIDALEQTVFDNKAEVDELIESLQDQIDLEVDRAQKAEQANAQLIENKADKATSLSGYGITDAYTKTEITDLIADITGGESAADVKAELTEFKTTTETELQNIKKDIKDLEGAERNYIRSVNGANFTVSEDGQLNLVKVAVNQVEGLQDILNTGSHLVSQEEKNALQEVLKGTFDNYIKSVSSDFEVNTEGNLSLVNVSAAALKSVVGDVTKMTNYKEGMTIVDELNDIRMLLTWQEMENV